MPLASVAVETLGAVLRFVVVEIVVEILFHATGRAILLPWKARNVSSANITAVGAVLWFGVFAAVCAWQLSS